MDYDYKEVSNCEICDKGFNLTRVRHKCKRCRLIICSDCGIYKNVIFVEGENYGETHRVCNPCTADINFRLEFEKVNKPSWNMTSKIGKEWYQFALDKGTVDDYEAQLVESKSCHEISKTIQTIKQELKTSKFEKKNFNFSMTEYLNNAQLKTELDRVRINIRNVLSAFHCKTRIQYNNVLPQIVLFLLTLTEEANAYTILCYITEKILPKDFWGRGSGSVPFEGFQKEKWIFRSFLEDRLMFNSTSDKATYFINFNAFIDSLLGGLMVNSCNLEVLIQTWNKMITGTCFRVMENYILKILHNMKDFMEKNKNLSIRNLQTFASRSFKMQNLEEIGAEYNAKTKSNYDTDWEKSGLNTIKEKFLTYQKGLKLLRELNVTTLEEFYGLLNGNAMNQSGSRQSRKSIIQNVTLLNKENFSNFLKVENEQQANIIFDCIDVYESNFISLNRLKCIAGILLCDGDIEKKIQLLYKIKDLENKESLDVIAAMEVIEYIEDSLTFFNQYLFSHNFKVEMYMLKQEIIQAIKAAKTVSSKTFIDIMKNASLGNLFSDIGASSSYLEAIEKISIIDDENVGTEQHVWRDKYYDLQK